METLWLLIGQVPGGDIDVGATGQAFFDALTAGKVAMAISFGITLAVWIGQKIYLHFKDKPESNEWLKWVACALATLTAVAAALNAESVQWYNVLIAAGIAWVQAMGQYSALKGIGKAAVAVKKKVSG